MHVLERILLYAVSLTSIVLLLGPDSAPEKPASDSAEHSHDSDPLALDAALDQENQDESYGTPPPDAAPFLAKTNTASRPRNEPASQESFVLKDSRGRPRMEIQLGSEGEPQILLNDQLGREIISLRVDENGTGRIGVRHHDRHVEIGPDPRGDLAVAIQGGQQEELRLSLSANGEAKLIAKGRSPATLALSSRADGAADIQIHSGSGTGGPLMSVGKTGEAAIGIANSQREYGPVMHLFDDGLGQLTINGPGSESGPTLIRTPDGTSIISVRHPNGQPAASMVGSPTGASILAVTNTKGTQQASLRSDQSGKVDIGVTEQKPSEKPLPKPRPKPPQVPQIELIHHELNAPFPEEAEFFRVAQSRSLPPSSK